MCNIEFGFEYILNICIFIQTGRAVSIDSQAVVRGTADRVFLVSAQPWAACQNTFDLPRMLGHLQKANKKYNPQAVQKKHKLSTKLPFLPNSNPREN